MSAADRAAINQDLQWLAKAATAKDEEQAVLRLMGLLGRAFIDLNRIADALEGLAEGKRHE